MGFSIFMFIESAAITLFQQFDRLLVALTLGPVASGVYSVATGVGLRLSIIAGNITEVLVPYASRLHSIGEHTALEGTVRKVTRYVSLITALVGGMLIVWMKELLSVWISPEYAANHSYFFCIIILAYGILSLSRPAHQTLVGLGKVRFTALAYFTSSIFMLTAVYLLSRRFDLIGAGVANLVMVLLLSMNIYLYWWFNQVQILRRFLSDLVLGVLPLVMSFVFVSTGFPWPHKLIYTLVLLSLMLIVLVKDPDFVARVKYLVIRIFLRKGGGEKDNGLDK